MSSEAWDTLHRIFSYLLALDFLVDEHGNHHSKVLVLDDQAKAHYVAWHDRLVSEPWVDPEAEKHGELIPKLKDVALRLTLILHFLSLAATGQLEELVVNAETMANALRLADWFKAHQLRMWAYLEKATTELGPLTRHVAEAIVALEGQVANGLLPVQLVTDHVNARMEGKAQVKAHAVGKAARTLGVEGHRGRRKRSLVIQPGLIANLRAQFGIAAIAPGEGAGQMEGAEGVTA